MSDRVTIRVDQVLIDALDRFRAASGPDSRSRQDVLRHIIEDWLATHGYLPMPSRELQQDQFREPPSSP